MLSECGMIIGASWAYLSISITSHHMGFSCKTVCRVYSELNPRMSAEAHRPVLCQKSRKWCNGVVNVFLAHFVYRPKIYNRTSC